MIDINELKQGDVLTIFDTVRPKSSTVEFIERSRLHSGRIVGYDLIKSQYVFNISKEYINDYCTSWKRDGVELLKQEEEKPLYVFCPIEKWSDNSFHIDLIKLVHLPKDSQIAVENISSLKQLGDYTFIGYSSSNDDDDFTYFDSLTYEDIYSANIFVRKFAVFVKTSELFVGGE